MLLQRLWEKAAAGWKKRDLLALAEALDAAGQCDLAGGVREVVALARKPRGGVSLDAAAVWDGHGWVSGDYDAKLPKGRAFTLNSIHPAHPRYLFSVMREDLLFEFPDALAALRGYAEAYALDREMDRQQGMGGEERGE